MKTFITILMCLAASFGGFAAQIDFAVNPQKYNAIDTPSVSDLPAPVEIREDTFIELSDVRIHYQVYGEGEKPLILVHGNGGSVNSLREAASYLGSRFTVYLPESRCHGQSGDPGVITYELMAKDIAEFIEALGLEKPTVIGHSDGAINALTLAAKYPDLPGAVIACGANSRPETFKPYFPFGVAVANIFRPDKLNDLMLTLPQFDGEYLSSITCPAYIVCGEHDIMWLTDTVYIHECVKGSDMAVIKGADHSSYMSHDGRQTYSLAKDWLEKKDLW